MWSAVELYKSKEKKTMQIKMTKKKNGTILLMDTRKDEDDVIRDNRKWVDSKLY